MAASQPIIVIADDDWAAMEKLVDCLKDFHVLTARTWPRIEKAVKEFRPDLVLLADTLRHAKTTAEKMVERLYLDLETRVLVLAEFMPADQGAAWRERGAVDCILHPTKSKGRILNFHRRVLEIV